MPSKVDAKFSRLKRGSSLRAQRSNFIDSTPSRLKIAASPDGLLAITSSPNQKSASSGDRPRQMHKTKRIYTFDEGPGIAGQMYDFIKDADISTLIN